MAEEQQPENQPAPFEPVQDTAQVTERLPEALIEQLAAHGAEFPAHLEPNPQPEQLISEYRTTSWFKQWRCKHQMNSLPLQEMQGAGQSWRQLFCLDCGKMYWARKVS